jgi:hypothetical protein
MRRVVKKPEVSTESEKYKGLKFDLPKERDEEGGEEDRGVSMKGSAARLKH